MITTNTILSFLLISITLVQTSWSKPTADEDLCLMKSKYEMIQPSETDHLLPPTVQLLKFTSNGLEKLTQRYAKGGKAASEQLLKDEEILNSKSVKVLEFKQNLTKFEEDYSKCDGLDALFELAESYSNTTSFYFDQDEASFDADSKFILGLLRKYKSEELDREFEKYFDVFVEDFFKKFESLKEDLSKDKDKVSKKISEWYVHFKTLKIYDDKIVAFEEFFELYE